MNRWWILGLALLGCKDKEKAFDVEAYCEGQVECLEAAQAAPADTAGTGYGTYGYAMSVDTCVEGWEASRQYYADAGCTAELEAMEFCLANEELSCVYGQYSSTACLGETLDMTECLFSGLGDTTPTDSTSSY